ncbi:hypothetical protein KC19_10G020200 [Ceratodon purpureus]|uniref:Uncharacterized protein n=1 Tax=Ceratodon purpureus TaxID=3225 RepID=A0A8T0GIC6_CERPU|nr:hypothetical protein KC19_10G020200 [Ceratodon purpureus]
MVHVSLLHIPTPRTQLATMLLHHEHNNQRHNCKFLQMLFLARLKASRDSWGYKWLQELQLSTLSSKFTSQIPVTHIHVARLKARGKQVQIFSLLRWSWRWAPNTLHPVGEFMKSFFCS